MATRRDQLHSYQFLTQRVISALVMRETDPALSPLRRGVGAVFGGIMITVIVATGFGIYGILTKVGGDSWKADGTVVIEKETGATFVYSAGALQPTLNLTSAMLAAGRPNPRVTRVAARSLAGVARGVQIGIPGAPDSLPVANNQVGLPWTMCAAPGTDAAGRPLSVVTLAVGRVPAGGRSLDLSEGVLVRDPMSGATLLVTGGRRHLLREPATVVPALFGALVDPVVTGSAWLNTLPAGSAIGPIIVEGRGRPSTAVGGSRVGDLLVAETGAGPQHYLVFDDGLAPITRMQQVIVSAHSGATPVPISVAKATAAPKTARLAQPAGEVAPPASPPKLVAPAGGDLICAVTRDAAGSPQVLLGGMVEGLARATATVGAREGGAPLADRVLVPAGRVAIVRAVLGPNAGSGSYFVVTDLGISYPVPRSAVLPMLGYQADHAVDVPVALVSRLPTGPALDPAAAVQPMPPA